MNSLNGQTKPFLHDAMFYHATSGFLAGVMRFIRHGLSSGSAVLVAVAPRKIDLLRSELGPTWPRVRFVDMEEAGRNPTRIIAEVLYAFADEHTGQRVAIVGEPIWPGRTDDEYVTAVQHEALINIAFAHRPVEIICPYDLDGLDSRAIRDAMRSHPTLRSEGGTRWDSCLYADPTTLARECLKSLPEPASTPETLIFSDGALDSVRHLVAAVAGRAHLRPDLLTDLRLAVNEVATNTVAHTDGPGILRVWHEHDEVVCEVRDAGHISDPLVGRHPVATDADSGRGLVLVNRICHLVQIDRGAVTTTIRLHMHLASAA
ncbi:sensor histidine kinase [Actinopolymorpha sp. B11F2]|uniref:sensor histidine kinase n=1 Tax=Actinopolymorpha sp. B11F2 TaxID=3160862 RepID=UPI0032E4130F